MKIKSFALITIENKTTEEVFDFACKTTNLAKVFHGYGPIPGIKNAEIENKGEVKEGSKRITYQTDGSVLTDEIMEFERGKKQAYKVTGFKAPNSFIIDYCFSEWLFAPLEKGSEIKWEFTFVLKSSLAFPIAMIIKYFMGKAQQNCLNNIKKYLLEVNSLIE